MTDLEKEMILDFSNDSLSKEEFLEKFPGNLNINKNYVLDALINAYENKNSEDVEYAMLLGFTLDYYSLDSFSPDYVDILCKLLLEQWHTRHEDIALALEDLKSPESIEALYQAAFLQLEYLNYDDTYALARKCIHALSDINTDFSIEKLKLLASSPIEIIREKAEKQLRLKSK